MNAVIRKCGFLSLYASVIAEAATSRFWLSRVAGVISDLDIWRAAILLIRRHGVDAELEAARLADLKLDRGDVDGQRVWRRIIRAIEALRAPPSGRLN